MNYSGTIKSKKTIYLDLSKDIVEPYTLFDFSELNDDQTIGIHATCVKRENIDKYYGNLYGLARVKILGPGRDTPTRGLHLVDAAFTNYYMCNIQEFGTGAVFDNGTWSTMFQNVSVYRCNTTLKMKNIEGAGESMGFFRCNFFNSRRLIDINDGRVTFNFYGCSFDYPSGQFFVMGNGARAHLFGCHIEGDPKNFGALPFIVDTGALFHMKGGRIDLRELENNPRFSNLFNSYKGNIHFDTVRFRNIPGDVLIHGEGDFSSRKSDIARSPKTLYIKPSFFMDRKIPL